MGFGGGFKGGSGKVGTDQEVSGTLHLSEEQSGDPSAPDTGGYLYVKSDDPSKVWYKGASGAAVDLTSGSSESSTGAGIAMEGSTADGILTRKDSLTASVEANLTFNASTNVLSVTGAVSAQQLSASTGLSGAAGQFGSLTVAGAAYAPGLFADATAFTASTKDVLGDSGTTIDADTLGGQNSAYHLDLANVTGELSLDNLPATLTASVLSGTTAVTGAAGQFGSLTVAGAAYVSGLFSDASAFTASSQDVIGATSIEATTFNASNLTASVKDVVSDSGTSVPVANLSGEISLDNLPATLTGSVLSGTTAVSGAVGEFGTISLAGTDLSTTLGNKLETSGLSGYFQTANLTASVKDVVSDSGTSVPVANLSGEISLDNLPATLTASVLSGTTAISGAAGQFGSISLAGADLSTTLGTKLESSNLSDYFQTANLTASVRDVVSDSGTSVPVANLSGEISLDNLPATLTASVLSGTTAVTGAAGQFGSILLGGSDLQTTLDNIEGGASTTVAITGESSSAGTHYIHFGDVSDDGNDGVMVSSDITLIPSTAALTANEFSASVGLSGAAGQFGTISLAGEDLETTLGGKASSTATTTIGSSTVTLGSTTSTIEGLTTLTASNIQVTNLDVVTINSVSQTETTLEIDDKLIISAVSASSTNASGGGLQIGGGQDVTGHASVLWDNTSQTLKIVSGSVDALHVGTSISSSLNMSASAFYGDGANLQNVDASKLGGQDSAHHLDLGNSTGTLSLDRLPATLTASVLSGTTAVSGATGQFGTITLQGADLSTELGTKAAASDLDDRLALTGGTLTGDLTGSTITATNFYTNQGEWPRILINGTTISATGSGGSDLYIYPSGPQGGVVSLGAHQLHAGVVSTTASGEFGNSTFFQMSHFGTSVLELTNSTGTTGEDMIIQNQSGGDDVLIKKLKLGSAADGNSQNFTGIGTLSASVLQGDGSGISGVTAGTATNVDVNGSLSDDADHEVIYAGGTGPQRVAGASDFTFNPSTKRVTLSGDSPWVDIKSGDASNYARVALSASGRQWFIDAEGSGGGQGENFIIRHSASSQDNRFVISASGEVGIGTTTPTRGMLDVDGAIAGNAITASVGVSGSSAQFGTATIGGTELVFNTAAAAGNIPSGSLLGVHDGGQMVDNAYVTIHSGSGDVIGLQARTVANTATNLQGKITNLGTDGLLQTVTASVSVSGAVGEFGSVTAGSFTGDGSGVTNVDASSLGGVAAGNYVQTTATTTIGTTAVTIGGSATDFAGIVNLTASYISASHIQATDMTLAADSLTIGNTVLSETSTGVLAMAGESLALSGDVDTKIARIGPIFGLFAGSILNDHDSGGSSNNSSQAIKTNTYWSMTRNGTQQSTGDNESYRIAAFYDDQDSYSGRYGFWLGTQAGTPGYSDISNAAFGWMYGSTMRMIQTLSQMKTSDYLGGRRYKFTYRIAASYNYVNSGAHTEPASGVFKIEAGFPASDVVLNKTIGTHTVYFTSATTPTDFVIYFLESIQNRASMFVDVISLVQVVDGEKLFEDDLVLSGNLDVTGSVTLATEAGKKVGVGTTAPQHTLDVPDMGGLILAYNQITGSRDGTGDEVLIGLRSTNYRTESNWAVQHETSNPTDGSQLKLTFTMPASGRAEISVPSGIITTQPHTGDLSGGTYDATWWGPETSDIEAALTASGYGGNQVDWQSRQAAVLVSLSTNSSSYVPAGPRSEFEHLVDWRGNNNLSYNRRFAVPSWVMTGAAGSSHTVYLAFCNDGNASTRIMTLAYGGTGSADINAPGFGPIVMKAVSLPSTS